MSLSGPLIDAIRANPADAAAHAALGAAFEERAMWLRAVAQYRTALALGLDDPEVAERIALAVTEELQVRPEGTISHNMHFRTDWLGRRLREMFPDGRFSVLDAGGGDGRLAVEVPDAEYVLAEPTTNGLFVDAKLSFGRRFDAVVCCHVVEHVPIEHRDDFLDVLAGMATRKLLLLQPVADEHTDLRAWQQTIFDITRANWAREHIDCDMPTLEDITRWCDSRGYAWRVRPNGSKPLGLAIVFLDFYARHGRPEDVARINAMFNELDHDDLDDPRWPNAWFIEIDTDRT